MNSYGRVYFGLGLLCLSFAIQFMGWVTYHHQVAWISGFLNASGCFLVFWWPR